MAVFYRNTVRINGGVILKPVGTTAERAAWWALKVSEMVRLESGLRAQIPPGAALCILPDDDLEVARHNLLATETYPGEIALLIVTGGPDQPEVIVWQDDML